MGLTKKQCGKGCWRFSWAPWQRPRNTKPCADLCRSDKENCHRPLAHCSFNKPILSVFHSTVNHQTHHDKLTETHRLVLGASLGSCDLLLPHPMQGQPFFFRSCSSLSSQILTSLHRRVCTNSLLALDWSPRTVNQHTNKQPNIHTNKVNPMLTL